MAKIANLSIGGRHPVRIMGILNTSPESFYKKSIHSSKTKVRDAARQMECDGADFIDVGGMSTAPYHSTMVSEKVETKRILDAVKIIQDTTNLPISADTCRAGVAEAALQAGADIINDITGLKHDVTMSDVISKYRPSVILCAYHNRPVSGNLLSQTSKLLRQSVQIARDCGVPLGRIVLDPSIGFFRKSGSGPFFTRIESDWAKRDISVIRHLDSIKQGLPVMVSASNKSFIGKILKRNNPSERLFGSIAAEVISVINGADIIRTHNVSQTRDAITVAKSLSR